MESPLFFSQLVLFALLWLFIILHLLQPKRLVTVPESPAAPEPMVTQRDLFKAAMSSTMGYGEKAQRAYLQSVRVKEIMVSPVVTVSPDTSVAAAATMIIDKGIGCLPVVEGTQLVGLVTKTDLLRCLSMLEAA